MKLAFITIKDPNDIRYYRGVPFFLLSILKKQGIDVICVKNLDLNNNPFLIIKKLIYRIIVKKKFQIERQPSIIKKYANQIKKELKGKDIDLILSPSSIPVALLDTDLPIVFWADATFKIMVNFYSDFTHICKETLCNGELMEKEALGRARLAIYTSTWAANSAIKDYCADPMKVKIIPHGSNNLIEPTREMIDAALELKKSEKCKLLWIGYNWERKGGDIALHVTEELNRSGFPTELIIIGDKPSIPQPYPKYIRYIGFIDKYSRDYDDHYTSFLNECHFLILPSRADCTPIVFSEAGSFGLPVITTNVGGIPSLIFDNINGIKFESNAEVRNYVNYIKQQFNDYESYKRLCISSFTFYKQHHNWESSVKKLIELFEEIRLDSEPAEESV